MALMARYPDKYFDLAVVDPPYGINRNGMNMGNSIFNTDSKKWDNATPNKEYFKELQRVSINQIIWGGNYFTEYLPPSQYFAIWDKGPTMYGRDFAECEFAWVKSGGTRIFKKGPNQPDRIHPTQKPIPLYDWIFKNYAKEGDKILDTHLGSGSSRISACKAGLDFTACELDADYFAAQEKRFKEFTAQIRMF
jgi:site-specific DNA-methyltransferase (adenine-specific)